MGPTILQISSQLRQIIHYHLDNGLLENALFLAERLYGLEPRSPDALHLLALCHHRLGEDKTAYDYIRSVAIKGAHLACAYVFAQVCLRLKKNSEGISALERARPLWDGRNTLCQWKHPVLDEKKKINHRIDKHPDAMRRHTPDAAAVYCLLGKLLQGNREIKRAVDNYVDALKLNPFMWDAFQRLCDIGANIRTSNIFKISQELLSSLSSSTPLIARDRSLGQENATAVPRIFAGEHQMHMNMPGVDPFTTSRPHTSHVNHGPRRNPGAETPPAEMSQRPPEGSVIKRETIEHAQDVEAPNAPARKPRSFQFTPGEITADAAKPRMFSSRESDKSMAECSEVSQIVQPVIHIQHKRTISGSVSHSNQAGTNPPMTNAPQRRSRRLFGKPPTVPSVIGVRDVPEIRKARATGTKGRAAVTSTVGRVVSGNRKPIEPGDFLYKETRAHGSTTDLIHTTQKISTQNSPPDIEALQWLLDLLDRLGNGYCASSRFQCQAALQHYQSVPQTQRETVWVLAQIGKTLYEQGRYAEAERVFSRMRKKSPSRMHDMEVYSTVLWHLKSDTELAFLAHELLDMERNAPEAWCAIGNSFSLQRDHDQALKCFRRATQLAPSFAYGFTLQGHEYSANEEYEKALQAYRRAISADYRHYNGWYGLAKVYEKLGKYDMAVEHYKAAASINATNAVLVWSIGMVLEKQKKSQAALAQYKHACELAPSSAMPRFKKARMLLNLQRFQEALEEFNILKDMVPDESNVHFMLGKVHKQLRNKSEAVRHFTIALNLDPKAAPYIKETMESIDQEDDDMSEDDDDDEMS